LKLSLSRLPGKMKGKLRGTHAPRSLKYAIWGLVSGTLSVLAIFAVTSIAGFPLLIGSFGASAVLLCSANESYLAQPRNLVGGHLVSAMVAVVIVALFGSGPYAMAFGVGASIFLMYMTNTTHPPGGRYRPDRNSGACRLFLCPAPGSHGSVDTFGGGSLYQQCRPSPPIPETLALTEI